MVADSTVFISHKQSGTILDGRGTLSTIIADELRCMKIRLYEFARHEVENVMLREIMLYFKRVVSSVVLS